jgi:hypothetical protein
VSWLAGWTFRREAKWMLWLGLFPVALILLTILLPRLLRMLSSA